VPLKFNDAHKNCRRSAYTGPILISKTGMALRDNSRLNGGRIVEIRPKIKVQRRFLLPFAQFLSDFENSRFILTKIVSRSHTCFRNKNPTSVARTATIFV
jgi:hypothetical protein